MWRRLTRGGLPALLIRALDGDYSLRNVRKGAPPMTTRTQTVAFRLRLSAPGAGNGKSATVFEAVGVNNEVPTVF